MLRIIQHGPQASQIHVTSFLLNIMVTPIDCVHCRPLLMHSTCLVDIISTVAGHNTIMTTLGCSVDAKWDIEL